jgi:hypothetical protein
LFNAVTTCNQACFEVAGTSVLILLLSFNQASRNEMYEAILQILGQLFLDN